MLHTGTCFKHFLTLKISTRLLHRQFSKISSTSYPSCEIYLQIRLQKEVPLRVKIETRSTTCHHLYSTWGVGGGGVKQLLLPPRKGFSLRRFIRVPRDTVTSRSLRIPALLFRYQTTGKPPSDFPPPRTLLVYRPTCVHVNAAGGWKATSARYETRESLFRGRSDALFHPRRQSCRTTDTCHTIVSKFPLADTTVFLRHPLAVPLNRS